MKKLLTKDKQLRVNYNKSEKKQFVLKAITNNFNYFKLVRWKASQKLKKIAKTSSKFSISNRCCNTVNKKRLNKHTLYSRHVYLKLARSGDIHGLQKSSW